MTLKIPDNHYRIMNFFKYSIILLLIIGIDLHAGINNPDKLRGPAQYGVFFFNQLPPQYIEDYYELYNKRLYYNEDNIRVNIHYMEKALRSSFRHPSKALCLLKTKEEGQKYKLLLKMDIYIKIMKNYLTLGSLYDKKNIYYFNMPFKKDLIKSLNYAKYYYKKAKEYWVYVKRYAEQCNKFKVRISLDYLEDELYLINNKDKEVDWDYKYTIDLHLGILEENLKKLQ